MGKLFFFVCVVLATTFSAHAQDLPPGMPATANGQIDGQLLQLRGDKQSPIADHQVILEVSIDNAQVLTLPKRTDAQGRFTFRFIDSDPRVHYVVSSVVDGLIYSTPRIRRTAEEKITSVQLIADGRGQPATASSTPAADMSPPEMPTMPPAPSSSQSFGWPQWLGLGLLASAFLGAVLRRNPFASHRASNIDALLREWTFLNSPESSQILSADLHAKHLARVRDALAAHYARMP